jgi:hypothetical protein
MTAAQRDTFGWLGLDPWQAEWGEAEVAVADGWRITPDGNAERLEAALDPSGDGDET